MAKKKSNYTIWIVLAIIVAVFLVGSQVFTVTETPNVIQQQSGGFITVPLYGYFKCQESSNALTSPSSGWIQKAPSGTLKCTDVGTLIQSCNIVFKMPSESELQDKTSGYGTVLTAVGGYQVDRLEFKYAICTIGETNCFTRKAPNVVELISTFGGVSEVNANKEITIGLQPNQYLYYEVTEQSLLTVKLASKPVANLRNKYVYRPFFVYRYDVFTTANGAQIGKEDCVLEGSPNEANYIIEAVYGNGKLSQQLEVAEQINLASIRSREARITFLSGFVARPPQYELFTDKATAETRYCANRKIYRIEEIKTPSGIYKVADTQTNAEVKTVECCNNGDVPIGYACENFVKVKLPETEGQECSALKQCPIVGFMPTAGKQVVYQECVSGKCVSKTKLVACNYNEECPNGYCQVDTSDPTKNKCIAIVPPIDFCGNGVCEASRGENVDLCAKDCSVAPPYKIDTRLYWIIGIFAFIALLMIVVKLSISGRKKGGVFRSL